MDYSYIQQAIAQLEAAATELKNMVDHVPPEQAKILQVREVEEKIRNTLAHIEAAINPPRIQINIGRRKDFFTLILALRTGNRSSHLRQSLPCFKLSAISTTKFIQWHFLYSPYLTAPSSQ